MDYWTAVDEIYNLTLSLSFFIFMFLIFYIGRKGFKAGNKYGGVSSIICGVCFLIFGYYNSIVRFYPYPYNGFMVWWIGIILLINLIFSTIIKREKRKISMENQDRALEASKKPVLRRYVERMTKENPYIGEITFKISIDPDNQGVRLRRRIDQKVPCQKADVYIDEKYAGCWYYGYHNEYLRWFDLDFELHPDYSRGKDSLDVKLKLTSDDGKESFTDFRYDVFCYCF